MRLHTSMRLVVLGLAGLGFLQNLQAQLEVRIFNHTSYTNSDFIYLLPSDTQSGTNFNISYGATNQMTVFQSTALSALDYNNTDQYYSFNIGYSSSLAMYISLNNSANAWINTNNNMALPSPTGGPTVGEANQWSQVPFGDFELSYTNGIQDNGDLTAINTLGIPMVMKTANGSGVIAQVGFTNTAAMPALLETLNTLPGTPWQGAAPSPGIIRYNGPNQAIAYGVQVPSGGSTGTNVPYAQTAYPAFTDYLAEVATRTNTTAIQDSISYSINGTTNWQFNYNMQLGVTNGVGYLNGSMTASNTLTPGQVYTTNGLSMTFNADESPTTNAYFSRQIYAAPATYTITGYQTNGAPIVTTNPGILYNQVWMDFASTVGMAGSNDVDYYQTFAPNIIDHIMGDVAFGFAGGFINSQATNSNGTKIGDLTSGEWWEQSLMFSALQTNTNYYSQYAAAIFQASDSIYAHPIGDRMGNVYPNSLALTNVGSWLEIHIYDSVAIPEPVTAMLVLASVVGFAGFKTWQKKNARRKRLAGR